MQAEAISLALEVAKYTTPAHLRALAIHRITEKAIDPDCPPAQQLKALELLGKMTEVALFTERREVIQSVSSGDMRDKLMESIRLAISNSQAIDVEAHQADDLLAELVGSSNDSDDVAYSELENSNDVASSDSHWDGELETERRGMASTDGVGSTPPTPDPLFSGKPVSPDLHSIPDIKSRQLTAVNYQNPSESITYESSSKNPNIETPPVNVSNTEG
jgi:hypothetical protein